MDLLRNLILLCESNCIFDTKSILPTLITPYGTLFPKYFGSFPQKPNLSQFIKTGSLGNLDKS